ncbi:unnamed protein product [Prorocentrum cordatum]|uniref:Uncharacterized protein n=1 Tax=Prorocentrum cordatum TaxID=2364126 RepID=A0ABN9PM45_9DINO|nr:unnamed protein product [Polarella glacialis]
MRASYEGEGEAAAGSCAADGSRAACGGGAPGALRPGNFHGVKGHAHYVSAISELHPSLPPDTVQSLVASEWYHPGLTARAVWCTQDCGAEFRLARQLDDRQEDIRREVESFWSHPDALAELKGVGSHTTQFDRLIAGNGTWVDVRLWRGRAFNRHLCEKHFRTICGIVEASPEVWSNPWSHVLLTC